VIPVPRQSSISPRSSIVAKHRVGQAQGLQRPHRWLVRHRGERRRERARNLELELTALDELGNLVLRLRAHGRAAAAETQRPTSAAHEALIHGLPARAL